MPNHFMWVINEPERLSTKALEAYRDPTMNDWSARGRRGDRQLDGQKLDAILRRIVEVAEPEKIILKRRRR